MSCNSTTSVPKKFLNAFFLYGTYTSRGIKIFKLSIQNKHIYSYFVVGGIKVFFTNLKGLFVKKSFLKPLVLKVYALLILTYLYSLVVLKSIFLKRFVFAK